MKPGDDFYAICREYRNIGGGLFSNERVVKIGTREEDIVVENFFLFKDKYDNNVVRLSYKTQESGGIWGMITDHWEQRPIFTFVPIDDLVKLEDIVAPLKD